MPPLRKHKSKVKHHNDSKFNPDHIPALFMSRQPSLANPHQAPNNENDFTSRINAPNLTNSMSIQRIQLNVTISTDMIEKRIQKKTIENLEVLVNENDEILISQLLQSIKNYGIKFDNALISIYNKEETEKCKIKLIYHREVQKLRQYQNKPIPVYTCLGKDPLGDNVNIKVDWQDGLEIKLRSTKSLLLENLIDEQVKKPIDKITFDHPSRQSQERKLFEVIEKVALWRRLYTGFYDQDKNFIQMPLSQAAEKVGISKKTLDDYLLQIRQGKRYGYDFNAEKDKKIGNLRGFVKEQKEKKEKNQEK